MPLPAPPYNGSYDPVPPGDTSWISNARHASLTVTATTAAAQVTTGRTAVKRLFVTNNGSVNVSVGPDSNADYDTVYPSTRMEIALPGDDAIVDLSQWYVKSASATASVQFQFVKN